MPGIEEPAQNTPEPAEIKKKMKKTGSAEPGSENRPAVDETMRFASRVPCNAAFRVSFTQPDDARRFGSFSLKRVVWPYDNKTPSPFPIALFFVFLSETRTPKPLPFSASILPLHLSPQPRTSSSPSSRRLRTVTAVHHPHQLQVINSRVNGGNYWG